MLSKIFSITRESFELELGRITHVQKGRQSFQSELGRIIHIQKGILWFECERRVIIPRDHRHSSSIVVKAIFERDDFRYSVNLELTRKNAFAKEVRTVTLIREETSQRTTVW